MGIRKSSVLLLLILCIASPIGISLLETGCKIKSHCIKSKCEEAIRRFTEALGNASSACSGDADCDTYPALVDCGGVVNRKSAETLKKIHEGFLDAGCSIPVECAPRIKREPRCDSGECGE